MSTNSDNNGTWAYFVDHLILPPENYTAIFEAEYASDMTSMSLAFTYEYQKQIIITVGAVAGAGILALILFWFFMSLRCCFQCIRCLPRAPTDEEIEKYNIPLDYFEEEDDDNDEEDDENDADNEDENKSNLEENSKAGRKNNAMKRHYYYQHISYANEDGQSSSMVDDDDNQSRFSRHSRSSGSRPHHSKRKTVNPRDASRGTDALTAANTSSNASPSNANQRQQESKHREDLEQGESKNTSEQAQNDEDGKDDEEENDSDYSDSDASASSYAWSEESWRDITKRLYPYTPYRIMWLTFFLICSLISLGCCVYIFLSTQTLSLGVRQVKETGISLFNVVEQVYNSSQQLDSYGNDLQVNYDNLNKLVQNYSSYTPLQYYTMQAQHEYIDPLCVALANDTAATQSLFTTFASALQEFDSAVQGLDTVVSPIASNSNTDDGDNAFTTLYEDHIEYYYADGVALYVLFGISVTAVLFLTVSVLLERKRAVQFSWVWMSGVYLLLWIVSVFMFVVSLFLGDWCAQESPVSYLVTETLPYLFKQSLLGVFDEEMQNKLIRNLAYYTACTPGLEDESDVHAALSSANALLSTLRTTLFEPLSSYNFTLSDASNATQANSCLFVVSQVNATLSRVAYETQTVLPASTSCPVIQRPLLQLIQRDVCVTMMRGSFRLWGSVSLLLMFLMCLAVASSVLVQYSLSWDDMKPPYGDREEEEEEKEEGNDEEEEQGGGTEAAGEVPTRVNEDTSTNQNHLTTHPKTKQKKTKKQRRTTVDEDLGSDSDGEVEVDAEGNLWLITPAVMAEDGHTVMVPARRRRLEETNHDSPASSPRSGHNKASNGRKDKTGTKASAKPSSRPVSLRSILTVEYWTRPLPATPNHSNNNSNRTNQNNNNNNVHLNGQEPLHSHSGYSNRHLPTPPNNNQPSSKGSNRRRSNVDPSSMPTGSNPANRRRRPQRSSLASSNSDTHSEMSSLSGSFAPPAQPSPPAAPQRRGSAYNTAAGSAGANSYHYASPHHQQSHPQTHHQHHPQHHPQHQQQPRNNQTQPRRGTQHRRRSSAAAMGTTSHHPNHPHHTHIHHPGTQHLHGSPPPPYGLVPQTSFMGTPSPPPTPTYLLQTQPSMYMTNPNNGMSNNISPTNANNTMMMPMGGNIAYF